MDVRNLPLASDSLVGFDYGINNWIFADFSYKPSYWLALKRESFAQYSANPFELIDAVFYRLSFEQMLSIYRLHDTPYPAARSWSKYTAREKLQSLIMNGHIQAFCVTDKVALRMANYFDPILHPPGASFSQNTGNPLVDKRNELAEMLGKDILNRWLGKVEADRAHFARWAVTQDLVEAWDFGVTAVDTVVDIIVGLADTAVFIVDVMEDEFTFHLKVNTALVKSAGHALTGEQEAAREALRQAGIVIGEKVKTQQEFMTEIAKKAQQGLNMLMRLYNDPLSRMLLFDFFDSLYKSQPYREQKNLKTRISIEIGVEVLLAIFTAGTASVAKRAGQAAASSARVAKVVSKAKRIGPFTAEAIDLIADISKLLDKTSMKSEKGKEVAVGVVPVDNVKKGVAKPPLAQNKRLNTYGDYLRDVLGPARTSHPEEYTSIIDAAKQRGVEVVDRPGGLAYEPALSQGKPGRLLLDPDASIGAMRHEFRHVLDDQASGYKGFRLMMDSEQFWKLEYRGYMEEIKLSRELKEFDVGRKVIQEMRMRRQEILGR